MNPDHDLIELARQMGDGLPANSQRFRELVEATLLPMIRCALRSGIGNPALVRWVRHQAPREADPRATPGATAHRLARVLFDRMLRASDPLASRETVLGA
jgi:hypothetical protein